MDKPAAPALAPQASVSILLEEYRALYGLVTFRMTSLDRRVPATGGTLAAFLGSVTIMPPAGQHVVLATLPIALFWFLRTTINHARSFEDVLRRLDEIEQQVNRLCGRDLLAFQSRHPSKDRAVGGRTGTETVRSVWWTSLVLLASSVYLSRFLTEVPGAIGEVYVAYAAGVGVALTLAVIRHQRYRYLKQHPALAIPS